MFGNWRVYFRYGRAQQEAAQVAWLRLVCQQDTWDALNTVEVLQLHGAPQRPAADEREAADVLEVDLSGASLVLVLDELARRVAPMAFFASERKDVYNASPAGTQTLALALRNAIVRAVLTARGSAPEPIRFDRLIGMEPAAA